MSGEIADKLSFYKNYSESLLNEKEKGNSANDLTRLANHEVQRASSVCSSVLNASGEGLFSSFHESYGSLQIDLNALHDFENVGILKRFWIILVLSRIYVVYNLMYCLPGVVTTVILLYQGKLEIFTSFFLYTTVSNVLWGAELSFSCSLDDKYSAAVSQEAWHVTWKHVHRCCCLSTWTYGISLIAYYSLYLVLKSTFSFIQDNEDVFLASPVFILGAGLFFNSLYENLNRFLCFRYFVKSQLTVMLISSLIQCVFILLELFSTTDLKADEAVLNLCIICSGTAFLRFFMLLIYIYSQRYELGWQSGFKVRLIRRERPYGYYGYRKQQCFIVDDNNSYLKLGSHFHNQVHDNATKCLPVSHQDQEKHEFKKRRTKRIPTARPDRNTIPRQFRSMIASGKNQPSTSLPSSETKKKPFSLLDILPRYSSGNMCNDSSPFNDKIIPLIPKDSLEITRDKSLIDSLAIEETGTKGSNTKGDSDETWETDLEESDLFFRDVDKRGLKVTSSASFSQTGRNYAPSKKNKSNSCDNYHMSSITPAKLRNISYSQERPKSYSESDFNGKRKPQTGMQDAYLFKHKYKKSFSSILAGTQPILRDLASRGSTDGGKSAFSKQISPREVTFRDTFPEEDTGTPNSFREKASNEKFRSRLRSVISAKYVTVDRRSMLENWCLPTTRSWSVYWKSQFPTYCKDTTKLIKLMVPRVLIMSQYWMSFDIMALLSLFYGTSVFTSFSFLLSFSLVISSISLGLCNTVKAHIRYLIIEEDLASLQALHMALRWFIIILSSIGILAYTLIFWGFRILRSPLLSLLTVDQRNKTLTFNINLLASSLYILLDNLNLWLLIVLKEIEHATNLLFNHFIVFYVIVPSYLILNSFLSERSDSCFFIICVTLGEILFFFFLVFHVRNSILFNKKKQLRGLRVFPHEEVSPLLLLPRKGFSECFQA